MNSTGRSEQGPLACPTCRAEIPPGRNQCVGCGKVVGEENRCPQCNSIAGVLPQRGKFVCAVCGAPRIRNPKTIVLGRGPGSGVAVKRGGAFGLKFFGGLTLGFGFLVSAAAAALVGAMLGATWGLGVGAVIAAASLGAGLLLFKAGSGVSSSADSDVEATRLLQITQLAKERRGVLTAAGVAEALGLNAEEADARLTAMADGTAVTVEITVEGGIEYWFREYLQPGAGAPRVRVDVPFDESAREREIGQEIGVAMGETELESKKR